MTSQRVETPGAPGLPRNPKPTALLLFTPRARLPLNTKNTLAETRSEPYPLFLPDPPPSHLAPPLPRDNHAIHTKKNNPENVLTGSASIRAVVAALTACSTALHSPGKTALLGGDREPSLCSLDVEGSGPDAVAAGITGRDAWGGLLERVPWASRHPGVSAEASSLQPCRIKEGVQDARWVVVVVVVAVKSGNMAI